MSGVPEYFQHARPELQVFLPAQYQRVLEIGCGAGGFRGNLRADCEYWGVEPNPEAATTAATRLTRVFTGIYEEVSEQLPDGYFDLVICNDVIEHMTDHDRFLEAIKRKMRPGACIAGSIPNIRFLHVLIDLLLHKDWPYRNEGVLDRTHLRFFTEKSLRRAFGAHGYTVEAMHPITPIPSNFSSPRLMLRSLVNQLLFWLLGKDTRYLQFGFRVKAPAGG